MPRRRSAVKRLRADKKRYLRNIKIKRQLKKSLKQFQSLLSLKKLEEAKALLKKLYSQFDKAAKKQIIHRKLANRKKSQLSQRIFKAT